MPLEVLLESVDEEERQTYPFHQAKMMRPNIPVESGDGKKVSVRARNEPRSCRARQTLAPNWLIHFRSRYTWENIWCDKF